MTRKQLLSFVGKHRLSILVLFTVLLVFLGRYRSVEILPKGGEYIAESMLDRLIERITRNE